MKSRLAILGLLVSGMLFSTAGAGLALQGGGSAQSGTNAAVTQYATATPTSTPKGGVLPAESESTPTPTPSPTTENAPPASTGAGALPAEETTAAQPTRQQAAAAETSQLPFTGFAAIPVLLGGLALLTGGLVLRRRTRSE